MANRGLSGLADTVLYAAGFPCTPLLEPRKWNLLSCNVESLLRSGFHGWELLQLFLERRLHKSSGMWSKQFWGPVLSFVDVKAISLYGRTLPLLAILENVYGILRVWDKVLLSANFWVMKSSYLRTRSGMSWRRFASTIGFVASRLMQSTWETQHLEGGCTWLFWESFSPAIVKRGPPSNAFFCSDIAWCSSFVYPPRDVALAKITSHEIMAQHCVKAYNDMKVSHTPGISVSEAYNSEWVSKIHL